MCLNLNYYSLKNCISARKTALLITTNVTVLSIKGIGQTLPRKERLNKVNTIYLNKLGGGG